MNNELMNNNELTSDFVMLTTFLGDDDFKRLGKNPEFRNHVARQKKTLANLLKDSFELFSENTITPTQAMPEPRSIVKQVYRPAQTQPEVAHAATLPITATKPAVAIQTTPTLAGNLISEITGIFAEKTGYPIDMLDPKLDLEADLGIDTVKQMEILGLIRRKYSITWKENFTLKQTPTIEAIVKMIEQAQVAA